MLDVYEYVPKATDAEEAADSYYTCIIAELNFPDSDGNTVRGVVRN